MFVLQIFYNIFCFLIIFLVLTINLFKFAYFFVLSLLHLACFCTEVYLLQFSEVLLDVTLWLLLNAVETESGVTQTSSSNKLRFCTAVRYSLAASRQEIWVYASQSSCSNSEMHFRVCSYLMQQSSNLCTCV